MQKEYYNKLGAYVYKKLYKMQCMTVANLYLHTPPALFFLNELYEEHIMTIEAYHSIKQDIVNDP
jgi:hypothetical protein